MTYTVTRYFSDDNLAELDAAILALRESAARRRPHIAHDAYAAIDSRLGLLELAKALLVEPVPPAFGG